MIHHAYRELSTWEMKCCRIIILVALNVLLGKFLCILQDIYSLHQIGDLV